MILHYLRLKHPVCNYHRRKLPAATGAPIVDMGIIWLRMSDDRQQFKLDDTYFIHHSSHLLPNSAHWIESRHAVKLHHHPRRSLTCATFYIDSNLRLRSSALVASTLLFSKLNFFARSNRFSSSSFDKLSNVSFFGSVL